jgi:hypothetical protein
MHSPSGGFLAMRTESGKQQSPINFELDLKEAKMPSIGWNLQVGETTTTLTPAASEEVRQNPAHIHMRITSIRTLRV